MDSRQEMVVPTGIDCVELKAFVAPGESMGASLQAMHDGMPVDLTGDQCLSLAKELETIGHAIVLTKGIVEVIGIDGVVNFVGEDVILQVNGDE